MPVYHTDAGVVEMLEWGEGDELVVLLHAAAAGPHSLAALATQLVRPGRRVIAPALDGYGATVMREAVNGVAANVRVVQACLDLHPARRFLMMGHSVGGLIGLLAAIELPPFDAMVLYEPIVIACLRGENPEEAALRDWDRSILADVERGITDGDQEAGIAAFVTAWNEVSWSDLPLNVRRRLIEAAPRLAHDMRAVSYHQLPLDCLGCVDTPVLLLQGARSPAITHRMTERLQELLPGAERVVLAGCGHMGPVQAPAMIAEAVSRWID